MKRVYILMVLAALLCLTGCSQGIRGFYGVYAFEEETYLSGLSSSTIDFNNERLKGTKYTIEKDLFKVEAKDFKYEIESPKYIEEKIPDKFEGLSDEFSNVRKFIGQDIKYQFTIYNKNGEKTYWRLYMSSKSVWISTYNDNNAGDFDIIMSIDKISR